MSQAALNLSPSSRGRNYIAAKTTAAFHWSRAPVRFLIGPWRSGKSTACVIELVRRAAEQAPSPDGYRYTRWVVVRNTYGELRNTTLKTFLEWFPNGVCGKLTLGMPITFFMDFGDLRAEFIFLALDKPEDVRRLLSLECTGGWINECRELDESILRHLRGRCTYPPPLRDDAGNVIFGGGTWHGVICDTNPPDGDHWLPKLEERVLAARSGQPLPPQQAEEALEPYLIGAGLEARLAETQTSFDIDPDHYEFFHQPSGLSAEAENLDYLPGQQGYYRNMAAGAPAGFVQVYVHGRYGSAEDGRPVYPEFKEFNYVKDMSGTAVKVPWHVSLKPIEPIATLPIFLGWDYGLTPACVVAQILPHGMLLVLQEIIARDMGVQTFVKTVVCWHLGARFGGFKFYSTGDPAGEQRADTDESTCHQILEANGFSTQPALSNAFLARREAVAEYLSDRGGRPGILIDPRCRVLIEGFKRGYRFKRVKVQGEERYVDKVDKDGNRFTHPHDALQYLCLRIQQEKRWNAMFVSMGQQAADRRPADAVAGY